MPSSASDVTRFFNAYPDAVRDLALATRALVKTSLPGADETLDKPARLVAYSFGSGYANMICVIIPSQKGVKLGFARGVALPDPRGLLEGEGKSSRYVQLKSASDLTTPGLKGLLRSAIAEWKRSD